MSGLSRNAWLCFIFGIFTLIVLAYAAIYHSIYKSDNTAFLFNPDAATFRQVQAVAAADQRLQMLDNHRRLLHVLDSSLATGLWPLVTQSFPMGGGPRLAVLTTLEARFEFSVRPPMFPPDPEVRPSSPVYQLIIYQPATNVVVQGWTTKESFEPTLFSYRTFARRFADKLTAERDSTAASRAHFASGKHYWSFWDFLYFSVITAGTVGYGDILPNRTAVRMVVVSQVLLSSLLLVVVLNLVLRHWRS